MRRLRRLLAVVLLAGLASAALATGSRATEGTTLVYWGGGQGKVTFDGRLHAALGYRCNDCHLDLFATKKQALITKADHAGDKACFACHDGKVAFDTCKGCHRKLDDPAAAAAPPVLTYEGATTIGTRIMPEAAKLFTARTGISFGAIGGAGAGAGFKAAVENRVSLGGLASDMKPEEKAQVQAAETIGYDVMGVFVHPSNPLKALSKAQLKEIFAGRVTNWKEVGGADQAITVYSESLSGGRATVKAFKDMVLGAEAYGPVKELDDATDCIEDVGKDKGGVAASSLSFATPQVVALAVDGAPPSRAAVQSGAYALKRPLILVSNQVTPPVQSFLDFMLTPEAQEIVGRSFVPVR